jgi:3-methylfumaryl-CoA hydratase
MTQATSSAYELDWTETREWIGKNLIEEPGAPAEPVERSTIRRQLEVLELDCPLHYDEDEARKHGYEGIIAPYHMNTVFAAQPFWRPGDESRWETKDPNFVISPRPGGRRIQIPTPGTAGFVSDIEMEYAHPLYVGDSVISVENKLVDVNPRKTRVGDGAFLTYENRYENQRGETVVVSKMTLYNYVPTPRSPE